MKCSFCGADNTIGSNFCAGCGRPLQENEFKQEEKVEQDLSALNEQNNNNEESKIVFYDNPNVSNVSEQVVGQNEENIENISLDDKTFNSKETKKMKKLPIIIALVVIVLAVLVALGVMVLNPSPKKIFTGFTNELYNGFEESFKEDYDTSYIDMELKPEITGTGSVELESIINNFNIKLSGGINYKNKSLIYNLKADYKNKDLLDADMQYDKNFYLILNNLYDKPIMAEESDFSDVFKKTDNEDIKYVVKGYVNAFNNSLKSDYLTSRYEEMLTSGQKIKVKVSTLNLNSSNTKEMSDSIINYLLEDEEFLKVYAKVNNETVSDVKKELKSGLGEELTTEKIEVSLYTKRFSNELVKCMISSGDTKIEIATGKQKDNLIIKVSSKGINMSIDLTCSAKYNEDIKLKDVKDAVNEEVFSENILNILENFTKQEGYKALDEDIEKITGSTIGELIMGITGSGDDEEYSYDEYGY